MLINPMPGKVPSTFTLEGILYLQELTCIGLKPSPPGTVSWCVLQAKMVGDTFNNLSISMPCQTDSTVLLQTI